MVSVYIRKENNRMRAGSGQGGVKSFGEVSKKKEKMLGKGRKNGRAEIYTSGPF